MRFFFVEIVSNTKRSKNRATRTDTKRHNGGKKFPEVLIFPVIQPALTGRK